MVIWSRYRLLSPSTPATRIPTFCKKESVIFTAIKTSYEKSVHASVSGINQRQTKNPVVVFLIIACQNIAFVTTVQESVNNSSLNQSDYTSNKQK